LNSGAGAGLNQWDAKNSSTSQKPTYVKGISGIGKMWVQNLINEGAELNKRGAGSTSTNCNST